jgi:hypothetical protein
MYCKGHNVFFCSECELALHVKTHSLCNKNVINLPILLFEFLKTINDMLTHSVSQ